MPARLTVPQYLVAIGQAAVRLAADADLAGLDAPVPTCPDWTVADLVGHQGTVHRWATAVVAGAQADLDVPDEVTEPPADRPSLLPWFRDGAEALLAALRAAPDDLVAAVFLRDAPPPRSFWARRQAHETTIHAADAAAARLGRTAPASSIPIDAAFAVDGIDELLTGFITRRSARLRSPQPLRLLVAPTDRPDRWLVAISDEPPVTTVWTAEAAQPTAPSEPDLTLTADAVSLYLDLWNRAPVDGPTPSVVGRRDVLDLWRDRVRVTWS